MNLALCLFLILSISFSFSEIYFEPEKHPNWKLLPPKNRCGLNYMIGSRIVNGFATSLGQVPWIVRIGYYITRPFRKPHVEYQCAGNLISKYFVLTAAHCVPPTIAFPIDHVRLGEYFTATNPDCISRPDKDNPTFCASPVQDIRVTKYFSHPNFNDLIDVLNDVALLKLERPPQLNIAVQPICLPYGKAMRKKFEGSVTLVAGWGLTELGVTSELLLAVYQRVSNGTLCQEIYKRDGSYIDLRGQICVGGINGKDSCNGDSGGPLIWEGSFEKNITERAYLLGVVSFGPKECGMLDVPGVYTRVTHYMQWILDTIEQ